MSIASCQFVQMTDCKQLYKEKRCFWRAEFYSECSGFHFKNKWFGTPRWNTNLKSIEQTWSIFPVLRILIMYWWVACNLNMRCLPQWQPYNIKEGAINGVKEAVEINFLYFHLGFRIKGTTSHSLSYSQIHQIYQILIHLSITCLKISKRKMLD